VQTDAGNDKAARSHSRADEVAAQATLRPRAPGRRDIAPILLLALIYFGAGKFGLSLAYINASASAVWPPTGIALAALLLFGLRLWPGIFIGAFLVNITTQGSVWTSLAIALGNTLEGIAGAWLAWRFARGTKAFERGGSAVSFLLLTALLSTAISATVGVTSLCLAGLDQWARYRSVWLTWWLGDVVSNIIIAPFLVIWAQGPGALRLKPRRTLEAIALLAAVVIVALIVFPWGVPIRDKNVPLGYWMLLPLIWAAFRFGPRGAVTAAFVSSSFALWGTLKGYGPFVRDIPNLSILFVQTFIGTITSTALVLAAINAERQWAEDNLRENEARKGAVLESALDCIVTMDEQGRITEFNPAAQKTFGWARGQVLGKTVAEIMVPPPLREAHWRGLRHFLKTGEGPVLGKRIEMTALRADGTEFPVELAIASTQVPGHPVSFTAYLRDLTERNVERDRLRESEARFRALADNIAQLAWMADEKGWVFWYNRRWYDYTGTTFDEMKGSGWQEVHHPHHVERVTTKFKAHIETGEFWEDTFPLCGRDGTYRWFLSRAFPIKDASGKVVRWFGTNTDITDLREAEQALTRHKKELEQIVAERTVRLTEMIQELEAFSYSIAHDMRAPLRAMQGFGKILLEDVSDRLGDEGQDYIRRINSSAARLDHLIRDVLDYSQMVRGEITLEPLSIEKLIEDIIQSYPNLNAHRSNIEIQRPLPPVMGNTAALTQVISNLLGNAIKFVPQGVTPRIRIRAEAPPERRSVAASERQSLQASNFAPDPSTLSRSDVPHPARPSAGPPGDDPDSAFVRFWFEDNGIGIAVESRQRIFGMFQRLNRPELYEGTGMGLAIVRKAVDRMGGRIGVESELGKGSRFWVELKGAKNDRSADIVG
jgi:PAS domain S-box-containing protein